MIRASDRARRPGRCRLGPETDWFTGVRVLQVPASGLDEVAGAIRDATLPLVPEPEPDEPPFNGHLTLARAKGRLGAAARAELAGIPFEADFDVPHVDLVASTPSPNGARLRHAGAGTSRTTNRRRADGRARPGVNGPHHHPHPVHSFTASMSSRSRAKWKRSKRKARRGSSGWSSRSGGNGPVERMVPRSHDVGEAPVQIGQLGLATAGPASAAPAGRPPSGTSGSCGRSRGPPRWPPPWCWSP